MVFIDLVKIAENKVICTFQDSRNLFQWLETYNVSRCRFKKHSNKVPKIRYRVTDIYINKKYVPIMFQHTSTNILLL